MVPLGLPQPFKPGVLWLPSGAGGLVSLPCNVQARAPTLPCFPVSGASVISTRCSETYETKTALLSLFGIPLWYHSQSPRVILQVGAQQG